jgi:hypothetical protein
VWVLIYIAMYVEGMDISTWGKFNTYEECIYEMRQAEIGVQFTNESMVCLQIPGEQIEDPWGEFAEPEPGDGSLY